MIIFQPELAKLSADMHYERLLTEAAKQRKLKLLPATSVPTWQLLTGVGQLAMGNWCRFITARFDSNGSNQHRDLIHR